MTDDIVGAQTSDRRELLRHALEALEKMQQKLAGFRAGPPGADCSDRDGLSTARGYHDS